MAEPVKDIMQFSVPVDSEHKSTKLNLLSFAMPHMRAFHLTWICFFITFISTFGPAALLPVVREALDMNKEDLTNAGIAAVTGTIGARVVMGSICDLLGPRFGMGITMLLSAAPAFGMALVTDALDFTMCRFGIGFGLASFVACQFWCSQMFNVKIVGTANAVSAGWGNLGGGVTHLLLPTIYLGIKHAVNPFVAWRWAFYVPGCMHILSGIACLLFAQDLPDGNYDTLKKSGAMKKDAGMAAFINAITNYRMIVCMALYACCFGVELTMDNIITTYLFDQFDLNLNVAGALGASFGLMNIFARALGGFLSDVAAKRWGMRGRLWVMFTSIFGGGLFCFAMGLAKESLAVTMVMMVIFSIFVQGACGATYGVVPFVSKRSLGVMSGFVGAGGNLGAVTTQYLFFMKDSMATYKGIEYMGIFVMAISCLCPLLWFPMWGSMFTGPRAGATEEDYYLGEYTAEERAAGLADGALRFATESKSQRGMKAAEAALAEVDSKSGEEK